MTAKIFKAKIHATKFTSLTLYRHIIATKRLDYRLTNFGVEIGPLHFYYLPFIFCWTARLFSKRFNSSTTATLTTYVIYTRAVHIYCYFQINSRVSLTAKVMFFISFINHACFVLHCFLKSCISALQFIPHI